MATSRAGWGFRALPRHLAAAAVIVCLAGCGGNSSASSTAQPGAASPDGSNVAGQPSTLDGGVAGAALPSSVDGVELQVAAIAVPDALDGLGGPELRAMLDALDLQPSDVSLVVAVDRGDRLAIGRWSLPDRSADAILEAWADAAGDGWARLEIGGGALAGAGPDGSRAWATAHDGVFVYVVSDERSLAEAALLATR